MGKIVEKKKKKKGRPSLLDLQKRNLREQQQQQNQLQQKRNINSNPHSHRNYRTAPPASSTTPNPVRRSTRRNPNPDLENLDAEEEGDNDEDDEDELAGKRREKKLKLVLKLPQNQKSSLNSGSLNSYGSDSNAEEDNAASNGGKKRKINAIGDGSGLKGGKSISGPNPSNTFQGGTKLDLGPSTPLPDKKLLLFILDRLQKKDTYGVYSEPADPEELPDYHEVIEHPMDFGTVRKKLAGGAYANLEQFEKDVFLICTNAMQYNAPDTVYFRQARSIHELAKKNFENLRQDSDDNEPEQKVVRRGRPPTKNLKKPIGRPSLDGVGLEFSSDATGVENVTSSNHDMRKGPHLQDKSGLADSSGRLHGSRSNDVYASWLADNKLERNDEFTGSMMRGNLKNGKKQFLLDENRRNTYFQLHPSNGGREPSVLTTFDGEKKQLMPVGVLVEHGYARSLARFAANLGPVAWTIASKKIERSLPAGVKFGPGWVGENDVMQHRTLLLPSHLPGQPSVSQPFPVLVNSSSVVTSCNLDSKVDKLSEMPEGDNLLEKQVPSTTTSTLDAHPSKSLHVSATTSSPPVFANRSPEPVIAKAETVEGLPHAGFNILNSSIGGIRPRSSFPIQGPIIHPGMNGFNGFNLAAQMGKLIGSHAGPAGFNIKSSQMIDTSCRTSNTNNVVHPAGNSLNPEEANKLLESRSTINSISPLQNPGDEAPALSTSGFHPRPSWQGLSPQPRSDSGLSPQQKPDSVPPDLNVRFQSPGSPSSSRVDSTQPDLALQL
ncbi:Histone acetylase PCAF [Parasponia andersonii]|uniref:Histone acetylase PCAF n=1 Tax=Parasponia andersonii TaxID=3476 RepID=A0A2P5B8B4_PARAD|nr:Histone acetylase PCAF [Parasponia andersonii]